VVAVWPDPSPHFVVLVVLVGPSLLGMADPGKL
jgi:hypothetical protein